MDTVRYVLGVLLVVGLPPAVVFWLLIHPFAGVPEVSGRKAKEPLLQEGIYGTVRHPRYLSVVIGTAGFSMFVNYVGAYLVVAASVPALILVAVMEERELAARFGAEYEKYKARVPAIFPLALRPFSPQHSSDPK